MRRGLYSSLICLFAVLASPAFVVADGAGQTVARCGDGWLEIIDGYRVLHLQGTPYEMGYQHGALLRESVRSNFENLQKVESQHTLVEFGPVKVTPRAAIRSIVAIQEPHIPDSFRQELQGLADGSGLSADEVQVSNFLPELFHCSGFALLSSVTTDGELYHGRVLDYATDWGLQEHAVLIVARPENGVPFVNVSYAGFIGSVTGMNAEGISIGEMGGGGLGQWNGTPMALLVRMALEQATSLDEAVAVFRDRPRTCEYYYVVSDGPADRAVGMKATPEALEVVKPGELHPQLPRAVEGCVLLSAGSRFDALVDRAEAGRLKFGADEALRLMDRPVAMRSNLHNALFAPKSGRLWVANAAPDGTPAAEGKYHAFSLPDLLSRTPNPESPKIVISKR